MSVKQKITSDLKNVLKDLGFLTENLTITSPANNKFGDYSTNFPLQLVKQGLLKEYSSPLEIAKKVAGKFPGVAGKASKVAGKASKVAGKASKIDYLERVEVVAPGFINFFIKPEFLAKDLEEILKQGKDFGKNEFGTGKKIQVEFVSANPTGPLTLPHGRGGALGDTLANVLAKSGYLVEREYYINDTGNQIRRLGESVLAVADKVEAKPEHYQGEYVKELAKKFQDKLDLDPQSLGHLLADYLLKTEIKPALEKLGIKFDEFYSERSLYERDLIRDAVEKLKNADLAYEQDGALWFKATKFGDEKDRVLMTSESGRGRIEPTYFLADIAHHLDVLSRGYQKRINVLGADHHGYGQRLKGVMEALGYSGKINLIFMQMVKLFKDGKEMRMSKRAGTYVTIDELLDLVGIDCARFFFLMYAGDSPINFDLDLAREKSNKNPVFYVQYAFARISNILAKVTGLRLRDRSDSRSGSLQATVDYGLLVHPSELVLIKHLSRFPDLIEEIAQNYQVQYLTTYSITLADLFHKFYENCQVLNAENEELKNARLALVSASKIVLANVLSIMGISAPERM